MNQLIIMQDKQILKRIEIKTTSVTFGRHDKNDVVLPDRTTSNHHARITVVRDDCFLEDLNSTNGTYVNQQRVERHLLEDGDVIGIGKYHAIFRREQSVENQLKRLSLHPKLVDNRSSVCLQVINGKRAGYIIPLGPERVVLGNLKTGQVVIERSSKGDYIMREMGMNTHAARALLPGETLSVEGIVFQFCLNIDDQSSTNSIATPPL
ncbi:MAG: FHA domain-containing protein [Thiothrix sp.]